MRALIVAGAALVGGAAGFGYGWESAVTWPEATEHFMDRCRQLRVRDLGGEPSDHTAMCRVSFHSKLCGGIDPFTDEFGECVPGVVLPEDLAEDWRSTLPSAGND